MLKLYIEPEIDSGGYLPSLILKHLTYEESSYEDCDYIICRQMPHSCTTPSIIQNVLTNYLSIKKKVLVFLLSDYNESLDIPENVLFFRSGMYKSLQKKNEHVLPYMWVIDELGGEVPFQPLPKKTIHPLVGFCGAFTSHPCRISHINKIKMNPDIKTKFILRTDYWGKYCNTNIVEEFRKNVLETNFTLSSRGAGNFSARFFQVLYMGRIPIVVNTDMVFPLEDHIPWRDIIVYCNSENELGTNIRNFWRSKDIVQAQHRCKEIYDNYLSPEKWIRRIQDEILIPQRSMT
jgi:hypothetical protein